MGNIFGDPVFHDRGIQRGEVLTCLLSMFYWIVKKWGAGYVLQMFFFQLYDIGITLPSQSASILYIQKHSHRRKEKDRQI